MIAVWLICTTSLFGCSSEGGALSATPDTIDLEWKPENEGQQTVTATLRNDGGSLLNITNVQTSCQCTVATLEKASLSPGATSKLTLDVQVAEYGAQQIIVTVKTDSLLTPSTLVILNITGKAQSVPQLWRVVPTTLIPFRETGSRLFGQVEIVTLEDSTNSPWIVGLPLNSSENTASIKCELIDMSEQVWGAKSTVLRTYRFGISATPSTFERQEYLLEIRTRDGTKALPETASIIIDPNPIIRVLPNTLEIRRQASGVSETELVLVADDDQPFTTVDPHLIAWCHLTSADDMVE